MKSVDVAKELGVSKPSVSVAMKKLRQENLIYFNEEGYIFFTEIGRAFAEKIYSRHFLLTGWLKSIGVSEKNADKDACLMEHSISDETYECLNTYYMTHLAPVADRA